jgi:hypothetical protein
MKLRIFRHITLPIILVIAFCAVALAQDSGQVLRVFRWVWHIEEYTLGNGEAFERGTSRGRQAG